MPIFTKGSKTTEYAYLLEGKTLTLVHETNLYSFNQSHLWQTCQRWDWMKAIVKSQK